MKVQFLKGLRTFQECQVKDDNSQAQKIGKVTSDKKKFHTKDLQKLNYVLLLRLLNLEGKDGQDSQYTWRKYEIQNCGQKLSEEGRREGRNTIQKRLFLQFTISPVTDDITNKCRNLNHEKHYNTYYVSNTGTLTNEGLHMWDTENTRRKKFTKNVMYEISKATEFLSQLSTDQMIILKLITEKYDVEVHATLMSYKQSLPAVKNNF